MAIIAGIISSQDHMGNEKNVFSETNAPLIQGKLGWNVRCVFTQKTKKLKNGHHGRKMLKGTLKKY